MENHAPLLENLFARSLSDHTEEFPLPAALAGLDGTCYWNGPARFARGDFRYRHWLDGDGMVTSLDFAGGRAKLTSRYVRSAKFVEEEAAGRPLCRTFGTAFDGDKLLRGIGLYSPVNVSVYPFAGTLLAFGEQGLPYELDPVTLETRGVWTAGGRLNEVTPFAAHAKVDHSTGELFNFGVSFSAEHPILNVFRFAPDGQLVYRTRVPLPYPCSIHDFTISQSFVIFHVSPYLLDMSKLMKAGTTLVDALTWEPERGSHIFIVSRETGELVASMPSGHAYCLHLVNGFEEDGRLMVDVVEYQKPLYPEYHVIPDLFSTAEAALPVRIVIDLATKTIVERRTLAYTNAPDFPAHDSTLTARPYNDFWMLGIKETGMPGRKWFTQVVHLSWKDARPDVWTAPAGYYLGGEPLVIPGALGEGRPVVMCMRFEAATGKSAFLVFDGLSTANGPMAVLELSGSIPASLHSTYHARH